ncbi:alpha/beta family hydrolase [Spirillospora sp. NPDC047279]|uniref:dienelactone hydrolase family protein n=1 Tax=Spirillospora sp. NPDC047279 TaxID=3155478 RepID=UPI0033C1D133
MTTLRVSAGDVRLEADLSEPVPRGAGAGDGPGGASGVRGVIVFAHGSGSGRRSPRNRAVAAVLTRHGFATLLFDLLTPAEEIEDLRTAHLRFNVPLLAGRLSRVVAWARSAEASGLADRPVGLFGASTGAAAALVAAAQAPGEVGAVVSRGGRPDLAAHALGTVRAPTLLIVGGRDPEVLALNEQSMERMDPAAGHRLAVVPGAGHLFEEPGALGEVARLSAEWFRSNLPE